MLVPIHSKSPYTYRYQHTCIGPHTFMVICLRRFTSIVKDWAQYWYGQCIIPVWESDFKNHIQTKTVRVCFFLINMYAYIFL